MPKYQFEENKNKPGYINVYEPSGQLIAELWEEAALVIVTMYRNMYRQDKRRANEMMYGYILGMTHLMLFADKYPKITVTGGPNGEKIMTVKDPVLGEVFKGDYRTAPGGEQAAETLLHKTIGKEDA